MTEEPQTPDASESAHRLQRLFKPDKADEASADNAKRTTPEDKDRDRQAMRGLLPEGPVSHQSAKNTEGPADKEA
ncbi:hypothetical protein [Streptomyces sp. YGL11-2]|uniref:hypothetical protein n=1 Tax=Streptomyces sp. YGL11-2 TaxID=3414028 RepID=UPI003CF705D5